MTSTTTGTTTTDTAGPAPADDTAGPAPADDTAGPAPADDKRDRLAERLRVLRRRLDSPGDDFDSWELDLYSYDESLVVAADLLDVEIPKGARGEMSGEQRQLIEERLAAAGMDVRAGN